MSTSPSNLTLNGYRVTGKLTLDPFRTDVRAVLEIPDSGPVREAFLNHVEAPDTAPAGVLEWSVAEGDGKPPIHYRVEGKILNTQFPETRLAVFQNYE